MAQITITLELTPETLEVLKLLTNTPIKAIGNSTPVSESTASDDTEIGKDKKAAKKSTAKDKKDDTPKETPAKSDNAAPAVNLTAVRAAALKLSKAGKQELLKEIFAEYGAEKLSEVSEEHYSDLLADLEEANG